MKKATKTIPITGGIYYIVRTPKAWKLVTYAFETRNDDANHYQWWEARVASLVAKEWIEETGPKQKHLQDDLRLLTYAFPRGRLSRVGEKYLFLHGADLTTQMGVSKKEIEMAFGIAKSCTWEFDEHEQCQADDKETMRRLLNITEDWNAVSAME